MTDAELYKLAQFFAEVLARQNSGRSGTNNFRQSAFHEAAPAARKSRVETADAIVTGNGVLKVLNRWKDELEEGARSLNGRGLRRAHLNYVTILAEMADGIGKHGKELAASYVEFIKANQGNHKLQQAALDKLDEYTRTIDSLTKKTTQVGQTPEQRESISAARDAANVLADDLAQMGIKAEKVFLKTNRKNGDYQLKNAKQLEQVGAINAKLIEESNRYVKDLKRAHDLEIKDRVAAASALTKSLFVIGTETARRYNESFTTRLKNFQTSGDHIAAARDGMTSGEFSEFKHTTRDSALLLEDLGLKNLADGMREEFAQFGLFGKEMREAQAKLVGALMNIGVKPDAAFSTAALDIVGQLAILENITQDQAQEQLTALRDSPYYMARAAGKNDAERLALAKQILVTNLGQLKAQGLSNRYLGRRIEEATRNRYATIIEKIQKNAMIPLYITEMEKLVGRTFAKREKELIRMDIQGALTASEQNEFNAPNGIGYLIGEAKAKRFELSNEAAKKGQPESRAKYIVGELISRRLGKDDVADAKEYTARRVREDTVGKATEIKLEKGLDGILNDSKESLNGIERGIGELVQITKGIALSVAAIALGGAGGYLLRKFGPNILRRLPKGPGPLPKGPGRLPKGPGPLPKGPGRLPKGPGPLPKGPGQRIPRAAAARASEGAATKAAAARAAAARAAAATTTTAGTAITGRGVAFGALKGLGAFGTRAVAWPLTALTALYGGVTGIKKSANTSIDEYAERFNASMPKSVLGKYIMRQIGSSGDVLGGATEKLSFGLIDADTVSNVFGGVIYGITDKITRLFDSEKDRTRNAMANGRQLDENGNLITPTNKIAEDISSIARSNQEISDRIHLNAKEEKERNEQQRNSSKYAARVRADRQSLLIAQGAAMQATTNATLDTAYRNFDSAMGV